MTGCQTVSNDLLFNNIDGSVYEAPYLHSHTHNAPFIGIAPHAVVDKVFCFLTSISRLNFWWVLWMMPVIIIIIVIEGIQHRFDAPNNVHQIVDQSETFAIACVPLVLCSAGDGRRTIPDHIYSMNCSPKLIRSYLLFLLLIFIFHFVFIAACGQKFWLQLLWSRPEMAISSAGRVNVVIAILTLHWMKILRI